MLSNIHKQRENNSIMDLYMPNTQLQQLSAGMPSLFHPPQIFMDGFYCNTV